MRQGSPPLGSWAVGVAAATRATLDPKVDPLLAGFGRPRSVLVTGASGFVGSHLIRRLVSQGHRVRGLSRVATASDAREVVDWRCADVTVPRSLRGVAEQCEVVAHLVGIAHESDGQTFHRVHLEGTRNMLEEARRAGVRRFIFLSAIGAEQGGSSFLRTKSAAEEEVRRSGLHHLIFRPSIIYGPGDHFTTALAASLRRLPVFPLPGIASLRLRPVSVDDVTDALSQAVARPDLGDAAYELAGPERLKLAKIVRIVARALRLRRPILRLPWPLPGPTQGWLVQRLGLSIQVAPERLGTRRRDVLRRADNPLRTVFRIEPVPFRVAVRDYL